MSPCSEERSALLFPSHPDDDRPSRSDFPADIPAHVCWRNGGVECRRCELEEQAEEAGGTLICQSTHHRREVHASPGTDRCDQCWSDAYTEQASQAGRVEAGALVAVFLFCLIGGCLFVLTVMAGWAGLCEIDSARSYCTEQAKP